MKKLKYLYVCKAKDLLDMVQDEIDEVNYYKDHTSYEPDEDIERD